MHTGGRPPPPVRPKCGKAAESRRPILEARGGKTVELLQIVMSSGLWAGVMAILLAWFQRRWQKSDDRDGRLRALVEAQKVLMIDRVRHLGGSYMEAGSITLEDKETLREMYAAYKALGGNGHLATVMGEIERLPVVVER